MKLEPMKARCACGCAPRDVLELPTGVSIEFNCGIVIRFPDHKTPTVF